MQRNYSLQRGNQKKSSVYQNGVGCCAWIRKLNSQEKIQGLQYRKQMTMIFSVHVTKYVIMYHNSVEWTLFGTYIKVLYSLKRLPV